MSEVPGTPATPPPAAPPPPPPNSEFARIVAEHTQYRAQNETYKAELQKHADAIKGFEAERATWAEERALFAAGLDGEAADAARYAYGKLAEKDRPKGGIAEWVAGIKADPTKAPRMLQSFLTPAAPATPATPAATPGAKPPPPAPGGNVPPAGDVTEAAINAAIAHAQKTGDWSEYTKLTAGIR